MKDFSSRCIRKKDTTATQLRDIELNKLQSGVTPSGSKGEVKMNSPLPYFRLNREPGAILPGTVQIARVLDFVSRDSKE